MKQDRARRTRERILDAAAQEFAANGYVHTTMQGVADRIGMTKGALYGRFDSKEALARALLGHGRAKLDELRARDGPEGCPLRALRRFTVELSQCLHQDVRLRAAFRLLLDGTEADSPSYRLVELLTEHLTGLIVRAQDRGMLSGEHAPRDIGQLLLAVAFSVQYVPFLLSGRGSGEWAEFAWGRIARSLAPAEAVS
ncbi:TetR family transcriptional regulator [Streptomyces vinaceus]|uniref:TetR family transcriptional regulator n=1 Tax=Streptomyces vinaceus TaxID=1960 RepID=UPI00382733CA